MEIDKCDIKTEDNKLLGPTVGMCSEGAYPKMSQEKRVTHFTALQALVMASPMCMIIDHLTGRDRTFSDNSVENIGTVQEPYKQTQHMNLKYGIPLFRISQSGTSH